MEGTTPATELEAVGIIEARARLGEGPVWDPVEECLLWVDIYNRRVHSHTPATGEQRFFPVGDLVGCLALTHVPGRLVLALRTEIAEMDTRTGSITSLCTLDLPAGCRLNDGKCDPAGRFWVGSMSPDEGGAQLFRYDPDGSLRVMESGLTISNGLGWSPDGRTFYLTDSPARRIYAYRFDIETGEIADRRIWTEVAGEPVPDGLTVDEEGCVWSAQWNGGCVIRFGPDGREVERVRVPVPQVTSCTLGGHERRDLYVTSASVGLGEQELDRFLASGDLFRVRVDAAGIPATRFGAA